ncbi:FecR family protein [Pedobacter sp. ok626]|uniref:FecR family protein n=1 Tax=Pedobacter sp. ok626 TaxID=1761882 RepID=UPI000B0C29C3|nr:FecR domain-containing protein [Pedobacter sp. ok626]
MLEKEFHISNLIRGHFNGSLTVAQEKELQDWLSASTENVELFAELNNENIVKGKISQYNRVNTTTMWQKTLAGLQMDTVVPKQAEIIRWPRFLIAASVAVIIGLGIYFYTSSSHLGDERELSKYAQDIKPGKNTATLKLSSGKVIQLSEAKEGVVIGADLRYNDNTAVISDKDNSTKGESVISTPRGGTYQVTLYDGTKVWLNSASSLTYTPALNDRGERKVKLDGEGYFEVAKDKNHPFIVESKGQQVKVLGTHFNINSYLDEDNVKTTLLEGSVSVAILGEDNGVTLRPNQQASLNKRSGFQVKEVNAENVIAWKNGLFMFNDEPLAEVMQKISRWYGVEVHITDPELSKQTVYGTISRYSNISKVLDMLEKTGEMEFDITGNVIHVKRK